MYMKKSKTWLVYISLIFLIIFRFFSTRPLYQNGDKVRITSTVLSDPIRYDTSQYLRISGLKVYLPLIPEISYGDKIIVEGSVVNGKLQNLRLQELQTGEREIFKIRKRIISFYQNTLPDPYSGLLAGIVLGNKGSLTNDFWEKVKLTGVAHVVVASGTNVTFVISFLVIFLANFVSRRKMISIVILSIILYIFVSGLQAPLIRAAIMGSLVFFAQDRGRVVNSLQILVYTSIVMLIVKPDWLTDIGFILSVVATASLLIFEKPIRERLVKIPKFFKEGLSTSLSAQIGVAPILFVTFGQFNILSPIINALVLWTIPYIMILGAVGGMVGILVPFVGKVILYLSYPLLWWFTIIVTLFNFYF